MIRLIIIDDHSLVRQSIRFLLSKTKEIQIVAEASNGAEGIALAREHLPDIILLDLKLPDISGLEVTSRLLRLAPPPNILVLSAASHNEFPQRTLKAGALGYVTKGASQEELIQAIKTIYKGQPFISSDVASRLALAKINSEKSKAFSQFTNKEIEVLMLCLRSVPIEDIAKRLHMSPKTVHSYRHHIFTKLGVHNDVGLMTVAVQEGLMTMDEVGG
jgi:two-component system, NarL family, invasion response regulator UvrY